MLAIAMRCEGLLSGCLFIILALHRFWDHLRVAGPPTLHNITEPVHSPYSQAIAAC